MPKTTYPCKRVYFRIERPDGTWDEDNDSGAPSWFHATLEDAEIAKKALSDQFEERKLRIVRVETVEEIVG